MSNIITQDDIINGKPFVLKWDSNPGSAGAWNPGWKQQTEADSFLELVENRPSIMNDARFITMESIEHDISYMRMDVDLQSMKQLSGANAGSQLTDDYTSLDETVPQFSRTKLVAEPFSAFSYTAKNFLIANIEKATFLPHMEQMLAERVGYSAEQISIYGIKKAVSPTKSGFDHVNGLLQQCADIKDYYDSHVASNPQTPMGMFTDIDTTSKIVSQLKKMLSQYALQKGNRTNAKFYVSSIMEGRLMEEADTRQTEEGDKIYFNGEQLFIWGVPVVVADVLDNPKNSYNEHIILANPDSIVYGFLEDITSENSYEHEKKAYLSSVDVWFDVLILYDKDVLCAEVPTPNGSG